MTRAPLARAFLTRGSGQGAELPEKKFEPKSANTISYYLNFFDPRSPVSRSPDLKAALHLASHAGPGLRCGVILVLLVGLSDRVTVEEVTDLHTRWIFALLTELYRLSLKKSTEMRKPAARRPRLLVFALT